MNILRMYQIQALDKTFFAYGVLFWDFSMHTSASKASD